MRLTIRGILVVAGLLSVTYLVVTTGATQIVNAIVTLSWRLAVGDDPGVPIFRSALHHRCLSRPEVKKPEYLF